MTSLLSLHNLISDTNKIKAFSETSENSGVIPGCSWSHVLAVQSGFLQEVNNSPRFLQSSFVHLSSLATLPRLADTSKASNSSDNNFEQKLAEFISSPAQWFFLSRVISYQTFSYFFNENVHILFLTLSHSFSLTSQPHLLVFFTAAFTGRKQNDITKFISSSLQHPIPAVILRWALYKPIAKELKEIKPCCFDSSNPFQTTSRGLKTLKWSKISSLNGPWVHLHLLPDSATFVPYSVSNAIEEGGTFR